MFNIGDKIAYPVHGAGVIEAIEEREILGEIKKYYVMKMPLSNMKVMIPLDNMEEVGIRPVVTQQEVDDIFAILAADETKMPLNWNRRYRANMDTIKSGNIYEVAEVVRNLTLRDREKALSTGEKKILNNAKQILLSEIILVSNINEDRALDLIEESVK
ncbi:CarD family transcriptional regulator [Serpentinicella sp. ANB-PHB4]|uniref:CarD family transcriptional regulator n=1 Tax=Serpentinicella sp. ANB-PHB4 TaxID=3074076 RepID=UPI00285E6E56|nr:CarD family transcriptional regulator [Serpentinicella sp. ANB-PHB4]MDR5659914.1 CarD family transcriptional regulator [Serpentinicella sp. ANB-PHB4]